MRIAPGHPAPRFSVTDIEGWHFDLEAYEGQCLMISFYRYAACPLCNLRIHRLIELYPELQARGLQMLAFFESPVWSIREHVGRQGAPFPIIPDPARQVYARYGVTTSWLKTLVGSMRLPTVYEAVFRQGFRPGRMEGNKALVPADFLIGPDLEVREAYYGRDISDHIPVERILEFLDETAAKG